MTVHEQSSNIDQEGSRDLRYKLLLAGQVFAEGQLASLNATFGNLDGRNMLSEGEGAPNAHAHFLKHIASVFEKRVDPGEQIELLAPDGALLLAGVIPGPSDVRWQAAGKPQRLLLVSPEDGIYLGCCMGLGFWSKIETAGQSSAVTFPSVADAEEFMAEWDCGRPADVWFVPVTISGEDGIYASIGECVAAGLPQWDPGSSEQAKPFPERQTS